MSDILILALTALLALGVLLLTVWGSWHTARQTPTRQRALTQVLGAMAGTALLGVVLPAVLLGGLNPFPIWAGYAVLAAGATAVLAWRWPALEPGTGNHPGLLVISGALLVVLTVAGVAVT
jgi:hypothetical protein